MGAEGEYPPGGAPRRRRRVLALGFEDEEQENLSSGSLKSNRKDPKFPPMSECEKAVNPGAAPQDAQERKHGFSPKRGRQGGRSISPRGRGLCKDGGRRSPRPEGNYVISPSPSRKEKNTPDLGERTERQSGS